MRIAVTGSTGFIGKYAIAELSKHPVEIVAIVRDRASQLANSNVKPVRIDLQNPPHNAFELMGKPDALIHLAWDGLPNYQSLHHFEDELMAHYFFLKGLLESGLTALTVAGTCFEYGMRSGQLQETLVPLPNNPYGHAKNALRCQLEYLQKKQPFALTWTRLFYVYGEGQARNSLFSQLGKSVSCGESVFNMSGGEQLRDYLPVTEVAKNLVELSLAKQNFGIINICSGEPISIRRLVEKWIAENNWQIQLNLGYYPYPHYEPMAYWGDRSKLDSILASGDVTT